MKRALFSILTGIFLVSCLVGCKYFVDDEVENKSSPSNGGVDFESMQKDRMFMQKQQMELIQRTIRGGGGGRMGRRPF